MRKEDVKPDMVVVYHGKVYKANPIFDTGRCNLIGPNEFPKLGYRMFDADCADLEPYNPKDYTTESYGGNLSTNDPLIISALMSNNRESDDQPITQEFIESFGFKYSLTGKRKIVQEYTKDISTKEGIIKVSLTVENIDGIDHYSLDNQTYNLSVFIEMKISTQSELRFLLTKGRIDCSK